MRAPLRIFGITYDGSQGTEYLEYRNRFKEKLWRFENNPMIDIVENHIDDLNQTGYLGILSHRFPDKTGVTRKVLESKFEYAGHADIYNLSPDLGKNIGGCGNFMDWSDAGHKGIKKLVQACCEHTGLRYENNPDYVIYANQFIAMKWTYVDYVTRVLKPSLELLENELWESVNVPAGYTAGMELMDLKRLTGLHFYNYVPFVLERMLMQYVHTYKIKTISLI